MPKDDYAKAKRGDIARRATSQKGLLKPYYDDGNGIVIYHGNCLDVLPTLGMFDLLLTDPPYGVAYVTSRRSRSDPKRAAIANDADLTCFSEAWAVLWARLEEDAHWYVFASPRRISSVIAITGNPKSIICWDKGDRGTVGDLTCGFGESWEAIFYGCRDRKPLNGSRPRNVIRVDWSSTMDPVHPTVKPVGLLRKLIGWSSSEGQTILDPFMGSGTTLLAAKREGRKAVGIELEERYCESAVKRLKQGVLF